MKLMLLLGLEIFFCGMIVLCVQDDHLLSIFLGMEFMALGVCLIVSSIPSESSLIVLLIFLCVAVAEAAVMLSFMVQVTRLYGNDRVSSVMSDKL